VKQKQYEIDYAFQKKGKKYKDKYFKAHNLLFGDGTDASNYKDNANKDHVHQRMADTSGVSKMGTT
jgi:hypothetical protein